MNLKKITAAAVSVMGSGAAFAADPGVEAINGLSATAALYITAAFGVAVAVAGGFWGIRFMKKAFSAAG